jgi:hypothetical protein
MKVRFNGYSDLKISNCDISKTIKKLLFDNDLKQLKGHTNECMACNR